MLINLFLYINIDVVQKKRHCFKCWLIIGSKSDVYTVEKLSKDDFYVIAVYSVHFLSKITMIAEVYVVQK